MLLGYQMNNKWVNKGRHKRNREIHEWERKKSTSTPYLMATPARVSSLDTWCSMQFNPFPPPLSLRPLDGDISLLFSSSSSSTATDTSSTIYETGPTFRSIDKNWVLNCKRSGNLDFEISFFKALEKGMKERNRKWLQSGKRPTGLQQTKIIVNGYAISIKTNVYNIL